MNKGATMALTRRGIVRLIGLCLAGFGVPCRSQAATMARLTGLFTAPASAAAVGRTWLAQVPPPRSDELAAEVMNALELDQAGLARLDDQAVRARLLTRISDDFARGDVVTVNGWVLSRVEVLLYAVIAQAA
jgi:hypothetical protein